MAVYVNHIIRIRFNVNYFFVKAILFLIPYSLRARCGTFNGLANLIFIARNRRVSDSVYTFYFSFIPLTYAVSQSVTCICCFTVINVIRETLN